MVINFTQWTEHYKTCCSTSVGVLRTKSTAFTGSLTGNLCDSFLSTLSVRKKHGFLWGTGLFPLVDNEQYTTDCVSHFALTIRKLRINSELNSSNPGSLAREIGGGAGRKWEEVGECRGEERSSTSWGHNSWSMPQTGEMASPRQGRQPSPGVQRHPGDSDIVCTLE